MNRQIPSKKLAMDAKVIEPPAPRFHLIPFAEVKVGTAAVDLVKSVIPRGGLVIVWGPPKCGKSFWVFDLTMHIALGWTYRERRVQQGTVVYLALEGGRGFRARIEAWRRKHLAGDDGEVPFYLLDVPLDLVADHAALIAAIKKQLTGRAPAVIVIDTLNRALVGDENKSDDMAKFVRAADAIRIAFGCTVIVVHHSGVNGDRPRGHTSLSGADDAQISVKRDANDNVVAKVEHMKDGEAGTTLASRLEPVHVAIDDDGDAIMSCVIVPVDGYASSNDKPKVTGAAKVALDLLIRALDEAGEKPPVSNHIPPQVGRTIRATTWRSFCEQGTLSESDDPDSRRKAFVRASKKLQELKIIGIWSDHVWLTGQTGQGGTR